MLAAVAVISGSATGELIPIVIDVVAALLAAAASRWPTQATSALLALLMAYIWAPRAWLEMGHYAALIVVLGAGLRQRRRQRLTMAVGSLVIFTTDQLVAFTPGDGRAISASLVWLALITAMWLLGNAFTAAKRAQDRARVVALTEQRIALARDMHDTVARSLTHLARRARTAAADSDDPRFGILASDASTAISQLRLLLAALRDPDLTGPTSGTGSLTEMLNHVAQQLPQQGHPVTTSVHGDIESIPAHQQQVLADVLSEAAANVQQHSLPHSPCIIALAGEERAIELVVLSQVSTTGDAAQGAARLGLIGARERLATVGGHLEARSEGPQWITRARIPRHESAS